VKYLDNNKKFEEKKYGNFQFQITIYLFIYLLILF